MCDVLLPPGVNPTAVKYIYHKTRYTHPRIVKVDVEYRMSSQLKIPSVNNRLCWGGFVPRSVIPGCAILECKSSPSGSSWRLLCRGSSSCRACCGGPKWCCLFQTVAHRQRLGCYFWYSGSVLYGALILISHTDLHITCYTFWNVRGKSHSYSDFTELWAPWGWGIYSAETYRNGINILNIFSLRYAFCWFLTHFKTDFTLKCQLLV
jgi:hypothetical protein